MRDYSQHKESKWLYDYLAKNKKYKETPKLFVDIGALDGTTNSNARMFLELGWKGILFEPNPKSFFKLFTNTRNFNCDIFNVAISKELSTAKFEIVDRKNFEGHSNLNNKGNYTVLVSPLEVFISENEPIGILDIDAEGHDTKILQYLLEDTKIRPYYIIIEANSKEELKKQRQILNNSTVYKELTKISVNTIWERLF